MGDPDSSGVGFVTQFDISEEYFRKFIVQTVGLAHHQELWVRAEELDEFNEHIVDGIKVTNAFVGRQFVLPEKIRAIVAGL